MSTPTFLSEGTFPSRKSVLWRGQLTGEPHPRIIVYADGNIFTGDGLTEPVIEIPFGDFGVHINDPVDAHDGSAISVAPVGLILSTDVQAALAEISARDDLNNTNRAADLAAHIADLIDAHDAAAISYAGGPNFAFTDLEAASDEFAKRSQRVANAAARTALVGMSAGDLVRETDTGRWYQYTGSAWTWLFGGTNPTAFRAYRTGASAQNTVVGANVTILWDGESYDYGNNFSIANERYTVPETADYIFGCRIGIANPVAGDRFFIELHVNGVIASRGTDTFAGGTTEVLQVQDRLDLVTNDLVTVVIQQVGGAARAIETIGEPYDYFWGERV